MKVIKRFFRFLSLTVLYLGFSCLAGVLGILLYGVTSDFVSEYQNPRAPASVKSGPSTKVTSRTPSSTKSEPITAAEVTDKNSLKAFVLAAKKHLEEDYDTALQDFRTQEPWKTKLVYLSVYDLDGNVLLSVNYPEWEGRNAMDWKNVDGKTTVKDAIDIGKNDGGFYKCRLWNPAKEVHQLKIIYITTFTKDNQDLILLSGFFL